MTIKINSENEFPASAAANWELDKIVQELRNARNDWRSQRGRSREPGLRELPSRDLLQQIIRDLCG
ncbi:MAG: serine acetyltransferase, partial [Cellvibrio sp.]|nr:serine acetyltransferase [Cellvibrio sp.]